MSLKILLANSVDVYDYIRDNILLRTISQIKDEKKLDPEVRRQLEETVALLARKLQLNKKIEIKEWSDYEDGAGAAGNSLIPGKAIIVINPKIFTSFSERERESVLAHELSHIKNNDFLYNDFFNLLIAIVTRTALFIIFSYSLLPIPNGTLIANVVVIVGRHFISNKFLLGSIFFTVDQLFPSLVREDVSISIFKGIFIAIIISKIISNIIPIPLSLRCEKRADKMGFSVCSEEGKKGFMSMLKKIRRGNIQYRDRYVDIYSKGYSNAWKIVLKEYLISEEGENRLDWHHPSIKTRISYLRQMHLDEKMKTGMTEEEFDFLETKEEELNSMQEVLLRIIPHTIRIFDRILTGEATLEEKMSIGDDELVAHPDEGIKQVQKKELQLKKKIEEMNNLINQFKAKIESRNVTV